MTRGDAPRVALIVGDTVGHIHPALAVAEALQASAPAASIIFLGIRESPAASIVARAGHTFVPVPGSPIRRVNLAGLARAAVKTVQGFGVARQALAMHDVQVAMGFGSFVTGGVLLAARQAGVPTMILEANVEFGLANRWLRPVVDEVVLGLSGTGGPTVGVPVTRAVHAARKDLTALRQDAFRVLVMSGSRGAQFLADRVPPVIEHLHRAGRQVQVWHQAPGPEAVRERYAAAGIEAVVEPFIENVATAYAWADVAITRAGASTIAELATVGVPALLVPLANASANHQAANAAVWQVAGAGLAMTEERWSGADVAAWLARMQGDPAAWRAASIAARRLAKPDAAAQIADRCVRMARGRRDSL